MIYKVLTVTRVPSRGIEKEPVSTRTLVAAYGVDTVFITVGDDLYGTHRNTCS